MATTASAATAQQPGTQATAPGRPEDRELKLALLACKTILTKLQLIHEGQTTQYQEEQVMLTTSGPWICERDSPYGAGECNSRNPARARRCRQCGGPRIELGRARTHRQVGSKPPRHTNLHADLTVPNGHAPDKDWSLWRHYEWRMQRAAHRKDTAQLLLLAGKAGRDYEIYTGKRPAFFQRHQDATAELLRDGTGLTAEDAAELLDAPVKWVREQRWRAGLDRDTGEPRPMSDRDRQIIELAAAGKSRVEIARQIGNITPQRVGQILGSSR